ncbi:unnamed protein product [Heterosigma akashiwo]
MFLKPIIFLVSIILTLSAGFLSANSPRKASLSQAKMSRFTGLMTTLRSGAMQHTGPLANAVVASSKKALSMSAVEASSSTRTSVVNEKYDIVKEDYIKEFDAFTTLYKHKKSGAEVMSVQIDDNNKVFGITFRTPPEDDTGVPHILEHSVLCGSRRYPSKEPFVDLLKGSLQTFLNAFTYPDRTCYPVASQNTKDFYNLINVYLDAVLFPRAVQDPLVRPPGGVAPRGGGPRGAADLQGRGVQRDEGRVQQPGLAHGPRLPAGAVPGQRVCGGLGRGPQGHPGPDLRVLPGLPRQVLPPGQFQGVLLRRRRPGQAAGAAGRVPGRVRSARGARALGHHLAAAPGGALEGRRALPGRGGRRRGAAHGLGELAAERGAAERPGGPGPDRAGPPALRHARLRAPAHAGRVRAGRAVHRRRAGRHAAAAHLQRRPQGRAPGRRGQGGGAGAGHPAAVRGGGLPRGGGGRGREHQGVRDARVQHGLLPPGALLHAGRHGQLDLRPGPHRGAQVRGAPPRAQGGPGCGQARVPGPAAEDAAGQRAPGDGGAAAGRGAGGGAAAGGDGAAGGHQGGHERDRRAAGDPGAGEADGGAGGRGHAGGQGLAAQALPGGPGPRGPGDPHRGGGAAGRDGGDAPAAHRGHPVRGRGPGPGRGAAGGRAAAAAVRAAAARGRRRRAGPHRPRPEGGRADGRHPRQRDGQPEVHRGLRGVARGPLLLAPVPARQGRGRARRRPLRARARHAGRRQPGEQAARGGDPARDQGADGRGRGLGRAPVRGQPHRRALHHGRRRAGADGRPQLRGGAARPAGAGRERLARLPGPPGGHPRGRPEEGEHRRQPDRQRGGAGRRGPGPGRLPGQGARGRAGRERLGGRGQAAAGGERGFRGAHAGQLRGYGPSCTGRARPPRGALRW